MHRTLAQPMGTIRSAFTELAIMVTIGASVNAPICATHTMYAHAVSVFIDPSGATALADGAHPIAWTAKPHKASETGITSIAVVSHHLSVIRK